jgi:hypothetical protein
MALRGYAAFPKKVNAAPPGTFIKFDVRHGSKPCTLGAIKLIMHLSRKKAIDKLLNEFHLNVLERKQFEEQPIHLTEVRNLIREQLQIGKTFPKNATVWHEGQPVFEGYFLESKGNEVFILHAQRAQPLSPFQLAEAKETVFESLDKLIDEYLRLEHHYSIDGVRIETDGA